MNDGESRQFERLLAYSEQELALLDDYASYIDREGDSFRVREEVREMVEFERHDLDRGKPKCGFDLLFCRNLLIYIDAVYRLLIFETKRDSLRPGGYLVIGLTETLPVRCRDSFEPVDEQHRIYRKVE